MRISNLGSPVSIFLFGYLIFLSQFLMAQDIDLVSQVFPRLSGDNKLVNDKPRIRSEVVAAIEKSCPGVTRTRWVVSQQIERISMEAEESFDDFRSSKISDVYLFHLITRADSDGYHPSPAMNIFVSILDDGQEPPRLLEVRGLDFCLQH